MSGRYLTDLAAVARLAGLDVIEMEGWQTRARGSGGYGSGRPTHVMVHHTASGPTSDGWPDANYCTHGSENRPVANLYLNRAGTVWVMAAGATNTNGSGGPLDNVPADSMNTYAIGVEAGNGGTGEPWPELQQAAYVELCAALCAAYHIPAGHVASHAEWAPGRKIDPAGPSRWAPGGGTWPMAGFRADVGAGTVPVPVPPPTPPTPLDYLEPGETMFLITAPNSGVALVAIGGAGVTWSWVYTGEDQTAFVSAGIPTVNASPAQFAALLDQSDNPVLVQPTS